jgi:hypothetical protein
MNKYKPAKRVRALHRKYKEETGLPMSLRDFVRQLDDTELRDAWFRGKKQSG